MKGTTDLWFASFLLRKGESVRSFRKIDRRRAEYLFEIDGDKWVDYKLEFSSSPEIEIKYLHEKLKDLVN